MADINKEAADKTVASIRELGGVAEAFEWDLADLDAIDRNIGAIGERLGPVDILVNNTGGPPPTPASGQDAATWRKYFDSMVLSVIAITDRVLPGMRERQWGRIITSTSSGVIAPIRDLARRKLTGSRGRFSARVCRHARAHPGRNGEGRRRGHERSAKHAAH